MSLAEVKSAIADKNKAEIAAVLDTAAAEAAKIISEAQGRAKEIRSVYHGQTTELLEAQARKERAASTFQAKTKLLAAKQAAISETFERAAKALDNLRGKEREAHLMQLVKIAGKALAIKQVRCAPVDVTLLRKGFPSATVEGDDTISGGFIAEGEGGTIQVDYTYKTILATLKEEKASLVRAKLFD